MANRILGVLFKKKYANGDTDTIYPKTRAQDVSTTEGSNLQTIATKVNGMASGSTKVAKSSTNGNILINGAQTVVYTHPNSGVTAGTYNRVTVNAQGHVTGASNVTDWTGTVSGNVSNGTVTSSQASSRSNLASGEKLSVSMGKIRKWFADLKSLAFVDKVGTANLDTTLTTFYNKRVTTDDVTQSTSITEAGWVADARVIRTLQNQINTLNSNVQRAQNILNTQIVLSSVLQQYTEVNIRCPVGTWTTIKSFQFPEDEELHSIFIEFGVLLVGGTSDTNVIMRLSRTSAGPWSESSFYVSKNLALRCTSASIIWAYENSTYNIDIFAVNSQITVNYFLFRPFVFYHG